MLGRRVTNGKRGIFIALPSSQDGVVKIAAKRICIPVLQDGIMRTLIKI